MFARRLIFNYKNHIKWSVLSSSCIFGTAILLNKKDNNEYTRDEVAKHCDINNGGIWVTYGNNVYDVTEFIEQHPGGGDKLILAAGKALEPFWQLYQQHLNNETNQPIDLVANYLKQYKIGTLKDGEEKIVYDTNDPYSKDPKRHPALDTLQNKPYNAQVPQSLIMQQYITPTALWYVRHHHPVPIIDPQTFRLTIEGNNIKKTTLSLDDLRHKFKQHEVTATLQCAGNRRSHYLKKDDRPPVQGLSWGIGAISTGKFSGPRLRDVLSYCGLDINNPEHINALHVQFIAEDIPFDASIPIEKAINHYGDVILALDMNDDIMPIDHGYPIRTIVPGHCGARNVKWTNKIVLSNEESKSNWQRGAPYKGFGPNIKSFEGQDFNKVLSVQELPVQSAIVQPIDGENLGDVDSINISGYAWSGGGRGIARVDVSNDGGETWTQAKLGQGSEQYPSRAWAWTFWDAELPIDSKLKKDNFKLCVKAIDASYNVQPESPEPIWNLRGILNNSWHCINVKRELSSDNDDDDDE